MAKPNNPRNGISKALEHNEKNGNAELCPPRLSSGAIEGPGKGIRSLGGIAKEQDRLYGLVFEGMLEISDYTKLMYGLMQMTNTIKSKAELDALEDAYIKQWQGVRIIAPEDHEPIPDPHDVAIEGEVLSDG